MKWKKILFWAFLLAVFFRSPVQASGRENFLDEQDFSGGQNLPDEQDLLDGLDFSKISDFLSEKEEVPLSFEEIIRSLYRGEEIPYETVGDYIKSILFLGFKENQQLFFMILAVSLVFSILKNYAKNFSGSCISEISFYLCYCFMMVLMLRSFSVMNETVLTTTENMTEFMKLLIPVYCVAVSFTMNLNSSAAAYSLIFMAVYVVEWLIGYFLIPLVQIYITIEFLNHLMEEERLSRLSELIADAVKFLLKAAVTFILGINIIQGMIAPAMDRLAGNSIAKTIQMVPGIGTAVNGMGQIYISSGLVIKNSIGAAGLIILVLLCGFPFLKMTLLAALYKLLSAVVEPIADKRLSGGMNGVANGGMLYLKILSTCLMLFFLTVALTTAATGLGGFG